LRYVGAIKMRAAAGRRRPRSLDVFAAPFYFAAPAAPADLLSPARGAIVRAKETL